MADSPKPTAPEAQKAAPNDAKEITLDTKDALSDLKGKLEIKDDEKKQKEWKQVESEFLKNKDAVKKMTQKSLDDLKKDINDENEDLSGTFEVTKEGEFKYNEAKADTMPTPESTPTTSEGPTAGPSLLEIQTQIPPNAQEEIANYKPNIKNSIGNWIRDAIVNIIAGFAPEWAARIRGFANVNVEKRAESAYMMLTGDEGRNILSNSPLSNIINLDHIDKNDFKKILAQYPNLDFSNKQNLEAAFLGKHADKPELIKYHRIYEGMRTMCDELSNPESITYNPEERLKTLLSYSRDETIVVNYDVDSVPFPLITPENPENHNSPEVQKALLEQAQDLDIALIKAKAMPEDTDDKKKAKEAAIKTAEESLKKFQEERKSAILTKYEDVEKRLADKKREVSVLEKDKSKEKEIKDARQEALRLDEIKSKMDTEIQKVMTRNTDGKWEIQANITAETVAGIEIVISKIEDNTATVEQQNLTEKEKKAEQEKIAHYKELLMGNKIIPDSEIREIEDYLKKSSDSDLQEKLEVMKSKVALIKMTVQKKNEMDKANRFIHWDNVSDNSREGWVEVEPEYSGGSYNEARSWLELDADGFAEVDWQLVRGDNYHVKRVGGLKEARIILNDNKEIIRKSTDPENLKIG